MSRSIDVEPPEWTGQQRYRLGRRLSMETLQFMAKLELQHDDLSLVIKPDIKSQLRLVQEVWHKRRWAQANAFEQRLRFSGCAKTVGILR